jgi:uncharacterized protein YndB with AHSA1/START domain
MRTVEASIISPAGPEQLWPFIGEPARWSQWLVIHKSWKGEAPAEAAEWLTATASATAMNMPISIEWTFEKVDPPHALVLSGVTRARVKLGFTMSLERRDGGTQIEVVTNVDGGMIDGPMGAVFKNALEGAMRRSLKKLSELADTSD